MPHVKSPRSSTVVGLATFSLPGIFGAAPAAGASAMIPPYLVSCSGLRWLRRRRRARDIGVARWVLPERLELRVFAVGAVAALSLGTDHQVYGQADDQRQ